MIDPLIVKWIHIASAIFLFGTGMGTAFHGFAAHFGGNAQSLSVTNRNVVLADWIFTAPTVVIQPLSGALLMYLNGWAVDEPWIRWSLGLYALAGACWLPVVWLQIEMHRLAKAAAAGGAPLGPLYRRYHRIWFALGCPAFAAMAAILWLMVAKPG